MHECINGLYNYDVRWRRRVQVVTSDWCCRRWPEQFTWSAGSWYEECPRLRASQSLGARAGIKMRFRCVVLKHVLVLCYIVSTLIFVKFTYI